MERKAIKQKIALLLALMLLFTCTGLGHVLAVDLTDEEQPQVDAYKQQQEALKTKISENQTKLDALKGDIAQQQEYVTTLQSQISTYQAQIDGLNANIQLLETQKAGIQTKIDALDADIHEIEIKINHNSLQQINLQQQIEDIYDELKGRLADLYKYGRTSTLELLLSSTDFHSFLITMEMSSNMAAHDEEMVTSLSESITAIETLNQQQQTLVDQINTKKAEHEVEIQSLNLKQAEIESSLTEVATAQGAVMTLEADARDYLSELDTQSATYQFLVASYESDMEAFEKKIDGIIATAASRNTSGNAESFRPSSGLIWPLQYSDVYISSNYGYRSDPATGVTKYHGGTDTCCWSGTAGKSVRAAAAGTVIVATFMAGGYGNYVVIDHGNGLTTVYGHNSSLNVSVGQHVNQGDVIAYAGQTGYATGPHCHFEVRENGTKVNPLNYCSP